jgi:hypothetical protein
VVRWIDPATGSERVVTRVEGGGLYGASRMGDLAAVSVGSYAGSSEVLVFSLSTGQKWRIFDSAGRNWSVHFDPRGRWLMTRYGGKVRLWRLPLPPDLMEMDRTDVLREVSSMTNVRVDRSRRAAGGFSLIWGE